MLSNFFDPMVFNKVIMSLYGANIGWFVLNHSWANASYWFFALGITATVTFGFNH